MMPETIEELEEEKKVSESSDELRKKSIEGTSDLPNSETPGDRYSESKRQLLDELGLGQYYDVYTRDEKTFNLLLENRIEQQRDKNLNTLSMIIDKCISSDKITSDLIANVLDFVGVHRQDDKFVEPKLKKRKLASPMMSPKGHRRYLSDATSFPTKDSQVFPLQVQSMQGTYPIMYHGGAGPTPWLTQQFNSPIPTQSSFQTSFPAGLGVAVARSREPSMVQNNENQAGVRPGSYSPTQIAAIGNTGASSLSSGPSNRASLMAMHPDSPQKVAAFLPQPPHQIQTQFRVKTEPASQQRRFMGHRRSQSATVLLPNASAPNTVKSPNRELQASPQKPVNFLIHTPKHPPPT